MQAERSQTKQCPKRQTTKPEGGKGEGDAKTDGNGKFSGKCCNGGKVGHQEANCWGKEENKEKQPPLWKPNSVVAASAVDGGTKIQLLLWNDIYCVPVISF